MMSDAMRWLDGAADAARDVWKSRWRRFRGRWWNSMMRPKGSRACLDAEFNHDLELAEERLFAIRALARKHNVAPDELPTLARRILAPSWICWIWGQGTKGIECRRYCGEGCRGEAARCSQPRAKSTLKRWIA